MKILFVNDCNRNEAKNPYADLIEVIWEHFPKEHLIHFMNVAENSQNGVEHSGGSWKRILRDIHLDYTIVSEGRLSDYSESDYDIKYKVISGNY